VNIQAHTNHKEDNDLLELVALDHKGWWLLGITKPERKKIIKPDLCQSPRGQVSIFKTLKKIKNLRCGSGSQLFPRVVKNE
jgi:hypothetical protein